MRTDKKEAQECKKNERVVLDITRIYENVSEAIFSLYSGLKNCQRYCCKCEGVKEHYIVKNEIVCEDCGYREKYYEY